MLGDGKLKMQDQPNPHSSSNLYSSEIDAQDVLQDQKLKKKKITRVISKLNGRLQRITSHFFFKWKLITQLTKMTMSRSENSTMIQKRNDFKSSEFKVNEETDMAPFMNQFNKINVRRVADTDSGFDDCMAQKDDL